MNFANYSIGEFLGIILITPFISYIFIALFEGLGIFRDNFFKK